MWAPQSIKLVCKLRYILNLSFHCQQSSFFKDRLIQLNLHSLTYWHEYLNMVFFLKAVTGRVEINPTVTFRIHSSTRTTRHTSNLDITLFLINHYKTTTFQRSFFNRTSRIWNALATDLGLSVACSLSSFKAVLYSYYS